MILHLAESWMSRNFVANVTSPLLWVTLIAGIAMGIALRALTEEN